MNILIAILQVLLCLICLMLIGIILLQRSKGQGAGLSFGGGAEAIFGAQMGNVLTRTTVVLGFLFLALVVCLIVLRPTGALSMADRIEQEAARGAAPAAPAAPMIMTDYANEFDEIPAPAEASIPAPVAVPEPESSPVPTAEEGD